MKVVGAVKAMIFQIGYFHYCVCVTFTIHREWPSAIPVDSLQFQRIYQFEFLPLGLTHLGSKVFFFTKFLTMLGFFGSLFVRILHIPDSQCSQVTQNNLSNVNETLHVQ